MWKGLIYVENGLLHVIDMIKLVNIDRLFLV